jgi:hypothetical protein
VTVRTKLLILSTRHDHQRTGGGIPGENFTIPEEKPTPAKLPPACLPKQVGKTKILTQTDLAA